MPYKIHGHVIDVELGYFTLFHFTPPLQPQAPHWAGFDDWSLMTFPHDILNYLNLFEYTTSPNIKLNRFMSAISLSAFFENIYIFSFFVGGVS
jgi:hypothetical protein